MDKFNHLTSYFTNSLYTFFDNMTVYSVTFLAWTSAVIAALLALTTIIFSQFNERLIQKTNNISKEIKTFIFKKEDYQLINEKINEIIYLLSNQSVYKLTLYFFFIISYLSGLLWIISGIGYILDQPEKSYGDLTVIILSLLAISTTFFILPIILIQFNKNPALIVDNKSRVSFREIIGYFNSITQISNEEIIKEYIKPIFILKLSYSGFLEISLKQEIPIAKITYIFEFVGVNNVKQIIKISSDSTERFNNYSINPVNKNETNFEGLFNMIQRSNYQNLYVYSMDKKELVASFKLHFSSNTETSQTVLITNQFKMTPDSYISDSLNSKKWMHVISEKNQKEYKQEYKLNQH